MQSAWNMICDHISTALFWCIFVKPVQTSGKRTETEAGKILPEIMSTNNFRVYLPICSNLLSKVAAPLSKPETELGEKRQSESLVEHFSSNSLRD